MGRLLRIIIVISLAQILFKCGSQKLTTQPDKLVFEEPFSTREYYSDDFYYRATSSAVSSSESVAHARAKDNALSELVSEIQVLVERSTGTSNIEKSNGENSFASSDYILRFATYVRKNIPNPRTIGKRIFPKENGQFIAYRAIEVKKSDIVNMLEKIPEEDLKKLQMTKKDRNQLIENIKKFK